MKYLVAVAVLLLMIPAAVFAHGVEIFDVTGQQDVYTIKFSYTDGTPMLFAKVKVFPPSSPDAPAQESIADRNGYFSFINDEPGEWRLTAEDGMGHKGEIVVTTVGAGPGAEEAGKPAGEKTGEQASLATRLILGLSLILNVFALYSFILRGIIKKRKGHAHQ
ncbi:nickel transport protein [Hollandina sp. SP2]